MIGILQLASILVLAANTPQTNGFKPVGEYYQPQVPIEVKSTNVWLATMMVYKIAPQSFSETAISNALALGSFRASSVLHSPDKKAVGWRDRGREDSTRGLEIVSALGKMKYFDHQAEKAEYPAKDVPSFEEVDRLAMRYLQNLGGDTNQIVFKPVLRSFNEETHINTTNGHELVKFVYTRGASYVRQINGIPFCGNSGRGGFSIEFGNHAKVSNFELSWRKLQPYKQYKTLSQQEIIDCIKKGQSVINDIEGVSKKAKKLTITGIFPRYQGEVSDKPQEFAFPYASIQVVADLGGTNTANFVLECPILDRESR